MNNTFNRIPFNYFKLLSCFFVISLLVACGSADDSSSSSGSTSTDGKPIISTTLAESIIEELKASLVASSPNASSSSVNRMVLTSRYIQATVLTDSQIDTIVQGALTAVSNEGLSDSEDLIRLMPVIVVGAEEALAATGVTDQNDLKDAVNVIVCSVMSSISGREQYVQETSREGELTGAQTLLNNIIEGAVGSLDEAGIDAISLNSACETLLSSVVGELDDAGYTKSDLDPLIRAVSAGAVKGLNNIDMPGFDETTLPATVNAIAAGATGGLDDIEITGYDGNNISDMVEAVSSGITSSIGDVSMDGFDASDVETIINNVKSGINSGLSSISIAGYTYDPSDDTIASAIDSGVNSEIQSIDISGYTGTWDGTLQFGSAADERPEYMVMDSKGNLYIVGRTEGDLSGQGAFGGRDMFIAKISINGNLLWIKQLGTDQSDSLRSVVLDEADNIWAVGDSRGNMGDAGNNGGSDVVVIKLNSDGELLTTKQFGTSSSEYGMGITIDNSSNFWVTGYTYGTFSSNVSRGGTDGYLAKLNASGDVISVKQFGTTNNDQPYKVRMDNNGSIIVAGLIGSGLMDNETFLYEQNYLLLTKLGASGDIVWSKTTASSEQEWASDLKIDQNNNIYIIGGSTLNLGLSRDSGDRDIFFSKYDPDGNELWTRSLGTLGVNGGSKLHIDQNGSIHFAGYSESNFNHHVNMGGRDILSAKYSSMDELIWYRQAGTTTDDNGRAIWVDRLGNVYVAGTTQGNLDSNTGQGGDDVFLIRYESTGQGFQAGTDLVSPQLTAISINGGDSSTDYRMARVSVDCSDDHGIAAFYSSESDSTPDATSDYWQYVDTSTDYSGQIIHRLSAGSGLKMLYVWAKDLVGNISNVLNQSITLNIDSSSVVSDTNQTASYTDTVGEDSDYNIIPADYTDNSNGTVTDNVTGLMWQKEDNNTEYNWEEARSYCNDLSLGGFSDWRLPNIYELTSLLEFATSNDTSIYDDFFPDTGGWDSGTYTGITSSNYWSSTSSANPSSTYKAWIVSFNDGELDTSNKTSNSFPARCVRGSSASVIWLPDFAVNGNGTVTHRSTGLIWQQEDDDTQRTWEDALTYCQNLDLGGFNDWRVPNVKELQTIVDYRRYSPAIDESYFPVPDSRNSWDFDYWTSTTVTSGTYDDLSYAWQVDFIGGNTYNGSSSGKTQLVFVRCVRSE